jgi:hypothetical protein
MKSVFFGKGLRKGLRKDLGRGRSGLRSRLAGRSVQFGNSRALFAHSRRNSVFPDAVPLTTEGQCRQVAPQAAPG